MSKLNPYQKFLANAAKVNGAKKVFTQEIKPENPAKETFEYTEPALVAAPEEVSANTKFNKK